jgi:hypothetical protein
MQLCAFANGGAMARPHKLHAAGATPSMRAAVKCDTREFISYGKHDVPHGDDAGAIGAHQFVVGEDTFGERRLMRDILCFYYDFKADKTYWRNVACGCEFCLAWKFGECTDKENVSGWIECVFVAGKDDVPEEDDEDVLRAIEEADAVAQQRHDDAVERTTQITVEAVEAGDFIACVADPEYRDKSKRSYDFYLMRVAKKFVLPEDRVNGETGEVEFRAGETLLEGTHYMYSKAYDKGWRRAEQRVWEPTPGAAAHGSVSSTTVISGNVTVAAFTVGKHVPKGAGGGGLVTVSRDEHNDIVRMRKNLNEIVW